MARARGADVRVAAVLGEVAQERLDEGEAVGWAADHDAVALLETPDAARDARVEEVDALGAGHLGAPLRVAEVRVAAVDDDVAVLEQRHERLERVLRGIAGGDHQPDDTRVVELADQLDERACGAGGIRARVGLDRVTRAAKPLGHVAAHPPQPDHSEIHKSSSLTRTTGRPRACSAS